MMNSPRVSLWLARITIFAVAVLFTMIGFRFVTDPIHAAANSGLSVVSAVGYTNLRAGIGGFPLGFAVVLWFSLLSSSRYLPALSLVATVAAVILFVRLYSAAHDGTFNESLHILVPEMAILVVSLIGIRMERRRRAVC